MSEYIRIADPLVGCTEEELEGFARLVRLAFGTRDRDAELRRARSLVFLEQGDELVGVAALKVPTPGGRRDVSQGSGVPVTDQAYPYEVGWVVVAGPHRGQGHSRRLVEAALEAAGDANVFATSHEANTPMHRTLERLGFLRAGVPYASARHRQTLLLFVRAAAPPVRDP